jgi:uncharacterized protein (TIGR02001 family)
MMTRSISRRSTNLPSCVAVAVLLGAFTAAAPVKAADLLAPKELPSEAKADTSEPFGMALGARLQSNYIFRGISQSNNDPSLQTYWEMQFFDNFLYAGFATYKTDLPTRPTMEQDLTAGIRPKLGPLQFDLGVIFYNYPNERRLFGPDGAVLTPANTDFLEFAGKVSYTYQEALTLGANVFYEGNWLGTHANATYASLTAKYNLPEGILGGLPSGFALSGELGHYWLGTTSPQLGSVRLPDYTYWNAGLSYTWKNFTVDLRYHDTDLSKQACFTLTTDPQGVFTGSGRSNWCGSAFVATASFDFNTKDPGIFAPTR